MTLTRETELGTVSISNSIISQIIIDGTMQPQCKNKVWVTTKRGRLVGIGGKFPDGDLAMNITSDANSEGHIKLEFNVVVRFGISIKSTNKAVADYIADRLEVISGSKPSEITINIAGVMTKQRKARRRTKVVYRYGS
ncbi:Asp23/Gls24 family envelope stress response protein [Aminicella lysinilytica]|uniref:Putative alkaline shock family protein YloU n=1 Tax=Aminicella lysinilytica TaxID=433323 RepID=A0A4R6PX64_9FIRM|nr:Asp23/Gls24 family envelope stress response protein [Aminicella lysinilytica]TDP49867.1 putative alkaline shock family protein YloU [Aminicella lysinilytica]